MTILAVVVAYLSHEGKSVSITNSVTPLLAVVVGLILVFRNGTSYDRYYEGRKTFGSLTSNVRNLSRLIWIYVSFPPQDDVVKGKSPTPSLTPTQLSQRKAEMLKLCLTFAYAVKHYLREEDGLNWNDYIGVVPHSFLKVHDPRTRSTSAASSTRKGTYNATDVLASPEDSRSGSVERLIGRAADVEQGDMEETPAATKRVRVKRSKDKLPTARTALLGPEYQTITFDSYTESTIPLPLVVAHEITRYLFAFRREGYLETVGPAGTNSMNLIVQSMVDQMTSLERIANTPIPKSYSIHLKQCVFLYLFALPFTLVKELGWAMVPVVTVVAFTLMGIEGIAEEIEMPFGYDDSDLPLDRYCLDLKEEVEYIINKLSEGGQGGNWHDDGEGDD